MNFKCKRALPKIEPTEWAKRVAFEFDGSMKGWFRTWEAYCDGVYRGTKSRKALEAKSLPTPTGPIFDIPLALEEWRRAMEDANRRVPSDEEMLLLRTILLNAYAESIKYS